MNARTTILLLVSVLVLGGYIWFVEREAATTAQRAAEVRRAIQIDPTAVTLLQIESGDMRVRAEKQTDGWMLTHPVQARADAGKIDRILAGLGRIHSSEVAAGDKDERVDLSEYGLEEPRLVLRLVESGRTKEYSVGRDAPIGQRLYVLIKETGRVLATDTNLLTMLPGKAADLRDRRLLVGSPEQISRIELRGPAGFIQLSRAVDGTWAMQQPIHARAGREAVRKLLDAAFQIRVERFVTEASADGAAFGLTDDATQITVSSEGQEAQTLFLGGPVGEPSSLVHAKIDSSDSIYAIPKEAADALSVGVEKIRDRRLVNLYPYQIAYVHFEQGEFYLDLLKKEEGDWWVVHPKQYPANMDRVDALLAAWSSARIEEFVDDTGTNAAAYGFDEVQQTIELARRGAPTRSTSLSLDDDRFRMQLGRKVGDDGLMVRIEGEPALYRVSQALLKQFSIDALFFRAREVLSLDVGVIDSVEVARDKDVQSVLRLEGGGFAAVGEQTNRVIRAHVESILNAVERLEVVRFVEGNPEDLSSYGLKNPSVTITLGLRGDGAIQKAILLGKALKDGGTYAMVRGDDVVFVIDDETAQVLSSPLLEGVLLDSHEESGDGEKKQTEEN